MNKMTLVRKGYKRRGLIVEESPSKLGNFLGKSKMKLSFPEQDCSAFVTDRWTNVYDVKVRRYATEANSKRTEISLLRAQRRKDSQGLN